MRQPTSEEILDKCPDVIEKDTIPTKNPGGRPKTGGGSRKAKWHSEEDRIQAATVYAVTGNARRTEEITGIPAGTIRQWKTQDWWPEVINRIRQEHDDELDVKFTSVVDNTIQKINDRLENGDYIYDVKKGELVRKPMGGKELAVVTSIMMDKRNMIRSTRKEQVAAESIKDTLNKLVNSFREMANGGRVIEGEVIRDEQEESKKPGENRAEEVLVEESVQIATNEAR